MGTIYKEEKHLRVSIEVSAAAGGKKILRLNDEKGNIRRTGQHKALNSAGWNGRREGGAYAAGYKTTWEMRSC